MRLLIVSCLTLVLSVGHLCADGIGNDAQPAHEMCAACHGMDGLSHMPKFPKLAGQNADYIIKQLEDFRHGRRVNDEGQMETTATVITDAQRLEAARYFSELPPPSASAEIPNDLTSRGRKLYETPGIVARVPACATCHTSASVPINSGSTVPRLMGQHRIYTAKQLHDFKSGYRANDPDGTMRSIAKELSDEDIEAIASFLEVARRDP